MSEQVFYQNVSHQAPLRATDAARRFLAPLIGLAMFWPMFRYASYIQAVFPTSLRLSVFGISTTAHIVFLCMLALIVIASLLASKALAQILERHRIVATTAMALGTLGVLFSMLVQQGTLPAGLLWPSALLVALSFAGAYLSWAYYFSGSFGASSVTIAIASFLLSYLFFSYSIPLGSLLGPMRSCLIMPVGTAICWWFASSESQPGRPLSERPGNTLGHFQMGLPVIIIAMLLIGAAVRGISYLHAPTSEVRLQVSLALSLVWLLLAILFFFKMRRRSGTCRLNQEVVRFVLLCWSAISLLFLAGLFAFLCLGATSLGSDLVIASRTAMSVALWILLSSTASQLDGEASLRVFLAYGLIPETVSWFLSHAVIPGVLYTDDIGAVTPETTVLTVIFGTLATLLTGFMVKLALDATRQNDNPAPMPASKGTGNARGQQPTHESQEAAQALVDAHLTERETSVVMRYAHGCSLGKVAEELGISKSTAQSHIKSAYRKLGVHSRDELIERLGG